MTNTGDLRLESASFSHDGGRDYNEDAVGDSDAFGAVRLFMLADGAGGQGGGDVAARTAIAAARSEFAPCENGVDFRRSFGGLPAAQSDHR